MANSKYENDNECKIFIGNLPVDLCESESLYTKFMDFGQVKAVYCHPPAPGAQRSWGFVTYFCKRDADEAVQKLYRKPPDYLRVEYATGRKINHMGKEKPQPKGADQESTYGRQMTFQRKNSTPSCEFEMHEELSEDTFMKVVVVYPIDSCNFWVCLKTNYSHVAALSGELAKNESSFKPLTPSMGSYCIAKYENVWYRATILSIRPYIKVFYIDFGNVTKVAPQDLRELPDIARNMKSQAILIKLTPGTSNKYENLPEMSELVVKQIGKTNEGHSIVSVEGHNIISEVEKKESAAENVMERGAGSMGIDMLSFPSTIKLDSAGILTAIFESEVYIRPHNQRCFKMLLLLQNELMAHCSTVKSLERPPVVGEILAAKFSDGNFYRAITKNMKHDLIEVMYIDFGNRGVVKKQDLKPLNEMLSKKLCLAVRVVINEMGKSSLTENTRCLLEKYVTEETIISVQCTEDGYVTIHAPHCTVTGRIDKQHSVAKEVYMTGALNILTLQNTKMDKWVEGSVVEILVHEVLAYDMIAATLVNSTIQEELKDKYQTAIDEKCKNGRPYFPVEGELCFAFIDGFWNRCMLKRDGELVSSESPCTVALLDTRETRSVKYKNLRRMTKQFLTLPVAGMECRIELKEDLTRKDKYAVIGFVTQERKLQVTVLQCKVYGAVINVPQIEELLSE